MGRFSRAGWSPRCGLLHDGKVVTTRPAARQIDAAKPQVATIERGGMERKGVATQAGGTASSACREPGRTSILPVQQVTGDIHAHANDVHSGRGVPAAALDDRWATETAWCSEVRPPVKSQPHGRQVVWQCSQAGEEQLHAGATAAAEDCSAPGPPLQLVRAAACCPVSHLWPGRGKQAQAS